MPRTRAPDYKVTADGLLEIGVVTRPHGIAGEVRVQVPPEYVTALLSIRRVYLAFSGQDSLRLYKVEARRPHQDVMLYKLEGVITRNDAEALRGALVLVRVKDLPALDAGRYYPHQLIGLRVVTMDGAPLGEIYEVLATGANDVYVVRQSPDAKEVLLPAIADVVRSVDLTNGVVTVTVPQGL
ncbi:MAG: ribosome maturation factor RimM [Candidatus Roseilinea sp.]|uniref:ribosome maturation factor RimM n=1 Tax=Candidatus Roseilinea sp. TaxID=2838777 RepID=UPI004049C86A